MAPRKINDEETSQLGEKGNSRLSGLDILKVTVWPLLVIVLAMLFHNSISNLLYNDHRDTTLKVSPTNIEIISKSVVAATEQFERKGAKISEGADERATAGAKEALENQERLSQRAVLWVDDEPANNTLLKNAFTAAGVRIFEALSNQEAASLLAGRKFDLAITDVKRNFEGPTAGLQILPELKKNAVPTIVFSGSWSSAHRGEESTYGALKITNDPSEVYAVGIASLARQSVGAFGN